MATVPEEQVPCVRVAAHVQQQSPGRSGARGHTGILQRGSLTRARASGSRSGHGGGSRLCSKDTREGASQHLVLKGRSPRVLVRLSHEVSALSRKGHWESHARGLFQPLLSAVACEEPPRVH